MTCLPSRWQYFWAVALVEGFSGGDIFVDCISKETTSAAIHPADATWQCELVGWICHAAV